MSKKPRPFTPAQTGLINAIELAQLAPRDEIEAAFRARSQSSDDKIFTWKSVLKRQQEEAMREHMRSLTRHEPCAFPGCTNTIEVRLNKYSEEWPLPDRIATLTVDIEGYQLICFSKVSNTKTITKSFYGCSPTHKEAIFRMEFDITFTLDMKQEEHIATLQYPVAASQESRWKVYEMARMDAWRSVAESAKRDLAHIRRTILPIALKHVDQLVDVAPDKNRLTDDLAQFKEIYTDHFIEAYLRALIIRRNIDTGQREHNDNHEIWVKYRNCKHEGQ